MSGGARPATAGEPQRGPAARDLSPPAGAALRLDPAAEIWRLPGRGALAHRAAGLAFFPGPVAEAAAAALADGPRAPEALFAALIPVAAPPALIRDLGALREGGLLVAAEGPARRAGLGAAELAGAALPDPASAPGPRPAAVFGRWRDLPAAAAAPGRPWAPVRAGVEQLAVGPLFGGEGPQPCRACLAAREAAHDDLGGFLAAAPGAVRVQARGATGAEAAAELRFALRALDALPDAPPGAIFLRDAAGGAERRARALPRGGCPHCGAPPARPPAPPEAAAPLRGGGYRPLPAEALLARLDDALDPLTGIVRELRAPPAGPAAAHVRIARHAFPLAAPDLDAVLRNRRGRSAGKGRAPAEAEAGAMAEALERYAGVARPGDPCRRARRAELDAPAIGPAEWTLHADWQLAEAARWRALGQPAAGVPDPVDPEAPMDWTPVVDALNGAPGWAPAALCWHQRPEPPGAAVPGRADSNGCAAGQTPADAMLQGLLELVERDAVALWWWTRARRPEVDPASLEDPWLEGAVAGLEALGYAVGLQDLTHDLGVPVAAAAAWPRGGRGPLLLGFGAHPAPGVAASRAVSEMLQALPARRPAEIGGDPRAGLGLLPGERREAATAERDLGFLIPRGAAPGARLAPDAPPAPATAAEALAALLARLAARGLRVWRLDQSRPDVPLPVVRMIAPGLRHFRPRFAPGRLDSPPAGWIPDPGGRNRLFIGQ